MRGGTLAHLSALEQGTFLLSTTTCMAPDKDRAAGEEFFDALRADEADEQRVQELLLGENLWQEICCCGWNLCHPLRIEQIAAMHSRSIVAGDTLALLAATCSPEAQQEQLCIPSRLSVRGTQAVAEDLRATLSEQEIAATLRLAQLLTDLRHRYFERIKLLRTTNTCTDGHAVHGEILATNKILPALRQDAKNEAEHESRVETVESLCLRDTAAARSAVTAERKIETAGDVSQLLALCCDPGDSVQELCQPGGFPRLTSFYTGQDLHRLAKVEERDTAERRMRDLFALRERYFEQVETLCGQLVHQSLGCSL
ncbi:MAG: hypothetical protein UY85_C0081G0002 [Candidatus Peribacteria bacterium GW2011_GWB1_54_5]|nr:MAG: hypothetical protein UY85_C0081G0002 [Candidatus Peribacteria bacterium GW2011_GWB1_54_5]KKW38769.1 MAG: hypothetical protein UY87_C0063G0002 [Candidatus Peribacteria bacterium GW2011_GWC2_54_8]KKW40203.1 MAG: hypothetical protein UY90_C0086G0009 [Candidatus Peregrinibacteria bacterium GW2011_GWA2_54_9]